MRPNFHLLELLDDAYTELQQERDLASHERRQDDHGAYQAALGHISDALDLLES